jgi:hypothetical protein
LRAAACTCVVTRTHGVLLVPSPVVGDVVRPWDVEGEGGKGAALGVGANAPVRLARHQGVVPARTPHTHTSSATWGGAGA